jgi:hypothetical protein
MQLRVLRLGLLQDGDVGVGVFPEGEEVFVGGERPDAGSIGLRSLRSSRLQSVGTRRSQMRQRSRPTVLDEAAVVENVLKLGGWYPSYLSSLHVRFILTQCKNPEGRTTVATAVQEPAAVG